ncbi:MAG: phosphodiesterase, partial [Burkholderiales bacterium]|nr:phosphodiesterase [Burkholderiales bacterium]
MKFVQVTDMHIMPPGQELLGLDPRARLDACIADINANHADAELCVFTGDLAEKDYVEAYRNL